MNPPRASLHSLRAIMRKDPKTQINYHCYAYARRLTVAESKAKDAEKYPGGAMAGFIVWIGLRSAEYAEVYPNKMEGGNKMDPTHWATYIARRAVELANKPKTTASANDTKTAD